MERGLPTWRKLYLVSFGTCLTVPKLLMLRGSIRREWAKIEARRNQEVERSGRFVQPLMPWELARLRCRERHGWTSDSAFGVGPSTRDFRGNAK
jgi:hypothetical protein